MNTRGLKLLVPLMLYCGCAFGALCAEEQAVYESGPQTATFYVVSEKVSDNMRETTLVVTDTTDAVDVEIEIATTVAWFVVDETAPEPTPGAVPERKKTVTTSGGHDNRAVFLIAAPSDEKVMLNLTRLDTGEMATVEIPESGVGMVIAHKPGVTTPGIEAAAEEVKALPIIPFVKTFSLSAMMGWKIMNGRLSTDDSEFGGLEFSFGLTDAFAIDLDATSTTETEHADYFDSYIREYSLKGRFKLIEDIAPGVWIPDLDLTVGLTRVDFRVKDGDDDTAYGGSLGLRGYIPLTSSGLGPCLVIGVDHSFVRTEVGSVSRDDRYTTVTGMSLGISIEF